MRKCVACGGPSRVYDTRETSVTVRRARECKMCGARWTTMEISHQDWLLFSRAHGALEMLQKTIAETPQSRPAPFGKLRVSAIRRKPPDVS